MCVCACICVCVHVCVCTCVCVCVRVYVYVYMCVYMYTCMYILGECYNIGGRAWANCKCWCTHTHTHTGTHRHRYTHIGTHTKPQFQSSGSYLYNRPTEESSPQQPLSAWRSSLCCGKAKQSAQAMCIPYSFSALHCLAVLQCENTETRASVRFNGTAVVTVCVDLENMEWRMYHNNNI